MEHRIRYIDNIKGFAILLVVMGHVIANWFDNFENVLVNSQVNDLFVWRLIYSFHMQLFMFCSGLFQPIVTKENTYKDIIKVISRRFEVLMMPYFFSGIILWYISGQPSFYWFLLILFEFIIINLSISFFASRFSSKDNVIELALFLTTFVIIHVVSTHFQKYEQLPLLDIGHLDHYVYFTTGYLVVKHNTLDKVLKMNVYTIALLLFIGFFIMSNIYHLSFTKGGILLNPIRPLAAIIVVFYFFKQVANSKAMKWFNNLGRHSLEIYILHFFFLLKLPVIGYFIGQLAEVGGGNCYICAWYHPITGYGHHKHLFLQSGLSGYQQKQYSFTTFIREKI